MAVPTGTLLDKQLASKLERHKLDILKLMKQGKDVLFKLSYELYMARNTCLEHDSEKTFSTFVEDLGLSKSGAYRAIARWEGLAPKVVGCPNVGSPPSFEGFLCFARFDDSALDELAKPSTPEKAVNAAVKIAQSGKGMTRQEALDLIVKHGGNGRSNTSRKGAAPAGVTDDQEPDFSTGEEVDSVAPDESTSPQDSSTQPPSNGKGKPVASSTDYGKCPACGGKKWTEDEFGVSCEKCNQPWGEPAGEVEEDRVKDLRSKTRKTLEAAVRCFDDLQDVAPSRIGQHSEAIRLCKAAMKIEREWK